MKPGQQLRGLPGGQLLPEAKFKDFKQPEPTLARCERVDHYADWIRAAKAGKKSMLPVEQACDWTEFALLGTLAERRYSTPGTVSYTHLARPTSLIQCRRRCSTAWRSSS